MRWQTKTDYGFPYLWCHMCQSPKDSGLLLYGDPPHSTACMRVCLECLDAINTYVNSIQREVLDA